MAQGLIDALHQLQAVENKLRQIRDQLDRKSRAVKAQTVRLTTIEDELADKHEEVKRRQVATAQIELQFKSRQVSIDKHRQQLNSAKSNKEYSAILTQLNTERADNSKLEDSVLQEMTAIDQVNASRDQMKQELDVQRGKLVEMENIHQQERQRLEEQIAKLEDQRQEAASVVPPTALAVFERVAHSHEGQAMAQVLKSHPKREEYLCNGCNMSIPVEVVNSLMTRDDLQQCQICGRVLYLEDMINTARSTKH